MGIWSDPPEPRTKYENWPTLLFSWWATIFAAFFIVTRLCGRKVRSGRLFREDWIMLLSMIPLFIRMALIHVVLLYGTNNVRTVGHDSTALHLEHRSLGARLVLPARIFYAMYIWTMKLTVSEFLKRITTSIWRRSYEVTLQILRGFLLLTFLAVVVATLAECHPFDHYWQVIPDPGPHCRLGYAQLFTMGICDIITDVLLVAFPIPIVLQSGQTWQRKFQLVALFSLSTIMIAVTATRIPKVVDHHGRQQYRTVWASCEILAATCVSNAVILGSFLRDRGTKKNKFRSQSMSDSIDRASVRRPTLVAMQRLGSDEDLFRSLGCRMPRHLLEEGAPVARPAPAGLSAQEMKVNRETHLMSGALKIDRPPPRREEIEDRFPNPSNPVQNPHHHSPAPPTPSTKRSASFFDVGGLLEDRPASWDTRSRSTTLAESSASGIVALDFASSVTPNPSRRGSNAFLADIGGLGFPVNANGRGVGGGHAYAPPPSQPRRHSDAQTSLARWRHGPPAGVLGPTLERQEGVVDLRDPGGLLGEEGGRSETGCEGSKSEPTAPLESTAGNACEATSKVPARS
ncbi:hypothetical protein LTR62_008225 [Meristemomyces frigidus]|uniref:Rhodopsin domain-containing protein n=1 Tax=Meristemomyces frigidus TaxID=1508187 RepID=A0AAN7TA07_9PEZI|nr:hypothetical protein LTR62_008225 [Meristemomyces frigidus]